MRAAGVRRHDAAIELLREAADGDRVGAIGRLLGYYEVLDRAAQRELVVSLATEIVCRRSVYRGLLRAVAEALGEAA